MIEDSEHIKAIIETKRKRLQVLEKTKANYGISCPAEIVIEIEDIYQEIAHLESQIDPYKIINNISRKVTTMSPSNSRENRPNEFNNNTISSGRDTIVNSRIGENKPLLTFLALIGLIIVIFVVLYFFNIRSISDFFSGIASPSSENTASSLIIGTWKDSNGVYTVFHPNGKVYEKGSKNTMPSNFTVIGKDKIRLDLYVLDMKISKEELILFKDGIIVMRLTRVSDSLDIS